ncbi:MAG: hypothetical protein IJM79_03855 [Erysipelotrichaceae bacterium]|nr:hypothetical protein [Erysipelotrichaceae bacterium]
MKKILSIVLTLMLVITFTGCQSGGGGSSSGSGSGSGIGSGSGTPSKPDAGDYLSRRELETIANQELLKFVEDFAGSEGEYVDIYLPVCLEEKQISEHKYEYYYVYGECFGQLAESDVKVLKVTVTAQNGRQYTVSRDRNASYKVYLTNVHSKAMNVRKAPYTDASIVDQKATGARFPIYVFNYEKFLYSGEKYLWYGIDPSGYSRWVADGIQTTSEYYRFDNGCSTKDMVLVFMKWAS